MLTSVAGSKPGSSAASADGRHWVARINAKTKGNLGLTVAKRGMCSACVAKSRADGTMPHSKVGVPGLAKRKVNPAYTAHTSPFYTAYVCQHPTCLPGTVFCHPECVLKHEHLVA